MLRFREKGLDKRAFVFDGKQYALEPYYKHRESMDLRQVYLDVNKSWTREKNCDCSGWAANYPPNGYAFHFVQEEKIGSRLLYTGQLQNGKDTLYTAWWYGNGSQHTISQLDWRGDVLRGGHKYSVVNITTASQKDLEEEIRKVLEDNPFREVIGRNR